jgi:sugar lactone lactonase YvrE
MKGPLAIALLVSACARAPQAPASALDEPTARLLSTGDLETSLAFPNGIASAPDGRVFVGSVTSGTLLEIAPGGTSRVLSRGDADIKAGTALRFDAQRGRLWGIAPDLFGKPRRASIVFALDVATGAVVVKRSLPEDTFVNDLALDGLGGVYVTDSLSPRFLHLDGAGTVSTFAEDERFAVSPGQLGLAGITRLPDGALLVGHFSSGELFRVRAQSGGLPQVEELRLSRAIANPDGMVAINDKTVLLCEGDYPGSHGRLLRLVLGGADGLDARIEVIRDNLESPVNLTRAGDAVLVTDARIRARMRGDTTAPTPTSFPIVRVALSAADQAAPFDLPGFANPEGTAEGPDGLIYVSNIGATMAPMTKDGDGRIDILDASGFVVRRNAFAGVKLDAPKGMAFVGGHLWVADIDRVVVIDPADGSSRTIDLRPFHVGLANDIAKESEHSVIVSATDAGALFRVDDEGHVTRIADGIVGANGLVVEGDDALVVGLGPLDHEGDGRLFRVDLRTGTRQQVGDVAGRLDGIDRLPNGQLLISDWISIAAPTAGRIVSFDGRGVHPWSLGAGAVHGPADLLVSRRSSLVVIPRTVDGVVTIVPTAGSGRR